MFKSDPIYDLSENLNIDMDAIKSNVDVTLYGLNNKITNFQEFLSFQKTQMSELTEEFVYKADDSQDPFSINYLQFDNHYCYWYQRPLEHDILPDLKNALDCFNILLESLITSDDITNFDSICRYPLNSCLYILLKASKSNDKRIKDESEKQLVSFFNLVINKATDVLSYSPDDLPPVN